MDIFLHDLKQNVFFQICEPYNMGSEELPSYAKFIENNSFLMCINIVNPDLSYSRELWTGSYGPRPVPTYNNNI